MPLVPHGGRHSWLRAREGTESLWVHRKQWQV